ncbi:unnamed protein product [Blepharisma stoltei]|uniref:Uncharacterized protein n=1 Tax=Blepharisma stoltei TaxID=1481888 RepID=A0AAU9IRG1_9CILI|nr:unnamed protein product [Blepharisma stoltei]
MKVETIKFQHHMDNIIKQNNGSLLVSGIKKNFQFMDSTEKIKSGKESEPITSAVSRITKNDGKCLWKRSLCKIKLERHQLFL